MKYKYLLLLFLLTLILPGTSHAQGKVTALDSLEIEIWPDYDRASVLVLLTGTLPAETTLPASVTLPFPQTAQLNAVARIDSSDGVMKDDIIYNPAPGEITFINPDLRFRLEYYLPYAVNNNQRTFNFSWSADLSVDRFQLRVQQPRYASSLVTEPVAKNVLKGENGFTYYTFPVQSLPAGQSFSVDVDYTMTSAQLSAASSAPPGVQEPALPTPSKGTVGTNWPIVAIVGIVIILVVFFVWQTAARRAGVKQPVARQAKAKTKSPSRFCHNCGNPTGKTDKFCSKCGSALKGP